MAFIKNTEEALDFIRVEHASLKSKLDETILTPKKLESYPSLPALFSYSLQYVTDAGDYNSSSYFKPHECKTVTAVNARRDKLLAICDTAEQALTPVQVANKAIIEHNRKVIAKIKQVMTLVGIPSSFSYRDPKSRARNPKPITSEAGYLADIRRNIQTADGYNIQLALINRKREEIKKWAQQATASLIELEKIQKADEQKTKGEKLLATLKVKYNVPFEGDQIDVEEVLLDRCQYLRLAVAMEQARNDFSEHYRVSYALNEFNPLSATDHDIVAEIQELCNDYEGDGRVFRDCEWNYSTIYSMVDSDLLTDWQNFQQLFGDF